MSKNINKCLVLFFITLLYVFVWGLVCSQTVLQHRDVFWINYVLLLISISILIVLSLFRKITPFSPIIVFSFVFLIMFFYAPMRDLSRGNILWWKKDFFIVGAKSSIYAFLGFVCFLIPFFFSRIKTERITIKRVSDFGIYRIRVFSIVGWLICFAANVFYIVRGGGNSLLYALSLGIFGTSGNNVIENIGFVSMLSYCLPTFTLLYFIYGRNKFLKGFFFVVMFQLQVARGFRFLIIQIALMFVIFYYLKKGKLNYKKVFGLGVLLFGALVIMTLFRDSIRKGSGIDFSVISFKAIGDATEKMIWDNFRIYNNYYAIVEVVPSQTNHLYGYQMFAYTIIMMIPRALWPSKPGNPGTFAQLVALGENAIIGGSAYPCLGEYYYEFGIFGIVIFCFVFGYVLKKVEDSMFNKKTLSSIVSYSVACSLIVQFVIRGYTPSNFWLMVFSMLPVWCSSLLATERSKNGQVSEKLYL